MSGLRGPLSGPVSGGADPPAKGPPWEPHCCCGVLLDTPCHPLGGPRPAPLGATETRDASALTRGCALPPVFSFTPHSDPPRRGAAQTGKGETFAQGQAQRGCIQQAVPGADLRGPHGRQRSKSSTREASQQTASAQLRPRSSRGWGWGRRGHAAATEAGLGGRRGPFNKSCSALAAAGRAFPRRHGSPFALPGTSGVQDVAFHTQAVRGCEHRASVLSQPWGDLPITIPWAAGLSGSACPTKAQLPRDRYRPGAPPAGPGNLG